MCKKWKQEDEFGHHTDLTFDNPNWLLVTKPFGWHGHYIDNSVEYRGTLKKALDEQGPSLIVARVDYRENMKLTERLGELIDPNLLAT